MIPYGKQSISDEDVDAVVRVLRGELLTTGPIVEEFEHAFASEVGAANALNCSSGTAALHLASIAANLGQGDCAIVPAITFAATANAARFTGADVVFCDVDPETGLMTPGLLREALARVPARLKPKAVFPVHLNGNTVDSPGIREVAQRNELIVIEDACHALGTTYMSGTSEHKVGECAHSDMSVFSFHPVKTISQGEGGMVTSNSDTFSRAIRSARNHGIFRDPNTFVNTDGALDQSGKVNPWYYEMHDLGFNYRQTEIGGALGLSQLARLPAFKSRRTQLAEQYDRLLEPMASLLQPVKTPSSCMPCLHLYAVLIDFDAAGKTRSEVMKFLVDRGIRTQVHYIPLNHQPYYRALYPEQNRLPGADGYYLRCLSLPMFYDLADEDQERVVAELGEALGI